ncbi:hypothetical protein G9A89_006283 [Geosiphon pyriformis]|nr:hypothetical protein G9A89_006283 [Geosiphon pyriformis]
METTSVLKSVKLYWSYLSSAKYAKCENLSHISLNCSVDGNVSPGGPTHRILLDDNKSRLASIYARHSAPISSNIVGGSSFPLLFVHNGLAVSGSSLEMKSTLVMSMELNDRFAALKHNLASLIKHVDKLVKRLNLPEPMVFQLSFGCQLLVTPLLQNQRANTVMSKNSGLVTGSEAIVGVVVFNLSVISKMEETLNNLSITVMDLSAKINNADLVWKIATCNVHGINVSAKQKDVVCWHVDSGSMVSIVMKTKLRSNARP